MKKEISKEAWDEWARRSIPLLRERGYLTQENKKVNYGLLALSIFLASLIIGGSLYYLVVYEGAFIPIVNNTCVSSCPEVKIPNMICPACPECPACPDLRKSCSDINIYVNGSVITD